MQVGDVVIRMAADLADLRTGFDQAKGQAEEWGSKLKGTVDIVTGALAALGVAASVSAFANAIKDSIDYADGLNDLSQKVGLTVETLGGLEYAAKQSGADLDTVAKGAQKLAEKMADAAGGNAEAAAVFDRLGVSIQNTDGSLKPLDDTLLQLADRFAEYKDGPEKAAIAQEIFSKGGAALIPMLNSGGDALRAAIAEYQKYGGVTTETAQAADAFNDALEKVTLMNGAFMRSLSAALLPVLQSLIDIFIEARGKGGDFAGVIDVLVTGVKLLGIGVVGTVAAFDAVGKSLGALAAAAVAIAGGEFSRAWSILKDGASDAAGTVSKAISDAEKIWDASTAGMATSSAKSGPAMAAPIVKAAKDSKDEVDKFIESMKAAQAADEAGLAANTIKQLGLLAQALDAGKIGRDDYNKWIDVILDKDPILKAEQEKINKALDDGAAMVDKINDSWSKEIGSLDDRIQKQKDANDAFGLGKTALIDLQIAHLDEKIAVEQAGDAYSPYAAHLEEVRGKLVELRDAVSVGEGLEQQKRDLETAAKAWDGFLRDVGAKVDDFVTDFVDNGAAVAFKNLWGDFKKWALQALADIATKQIVVPIIGSVMAGPANAAGGGGGGIFDTIAGIGGKVAGVFTDMGSAASTFVDVLGTGAPIGQAFNAALATGSLSLGSLVPVVGGVIAAGTLLYNWLGSKRGGPKEGGFATSGATPGISGTDSSGRWFTPSGMDSGMQSAVNELDQTFDKWIDFFGGTGSATFAQGFSTDPQGSAPSNVHTGAWVNGQQVFDNPNGNVGRDDESLQTELATQASRAILAALQASELPDVIHGYLASIDVSTATIEQINAALAHAADLKVLVDQVSALPVDMANGLLSALGVDPALDAKIAAFAASFKEFSDAADKLHAAIERNPGKEAADQMAAATETTFQSVGRLRGSLEDALSVYDGTTASTKLLTDATNAYVDAQVAALVQIIQVRDGLAGLFGDTIRNMDLALMSADQQKQFYINEALQAQALLANATDPAEIDRLTRLINNDLTAAFQLMDPDEQRAQHDYLRGILDTAQTTANTQLDLAQQAVEDAGENATDILGRIDTAVSAAADKQAQAALDLIAAASAMRDAAEAAKAAAEAQAAAATNTATAAGTMNTAANTMDRAANTPISVFVDINQNSGP
jgi:hypothetical protein